MKKIRLFSIIISSLFLISGCSDSSQTSKTAKQESSNIISESETTAPTTEPTTEVNLDDYKAKLLDFNDYVYNASILLSNCAQYEYSYWEKLDSLNGEVTSEKLYIKAVEWLMENSTAEFNMTETKLEDDYKTICSSYSEIVAMGIDSAEVSAINDAFEKLFENYCFLYTLTIEPGGSLSNFGDNYNEYVDNIRNYNTMLSAFLE